MTRAGTAANGVKRNEMKVGRKRTAIVLGSVDGAFRRLRAQVLASKRCSGVGCKRKARAELIQFIHGGKTLEVSL